MATPTITPIFSVSNKTNYCKEKEWVQFLPEEFRNTTLLTCKELPPKLIEWGLQYIKNFCAKQLSVFLYGQYGCGKTTFTFALIRQIFKQINGRFYFWPRFVTARTFDRNLLNASKSTEGDSWILETYSQCDLLFIDDLDKVMPSERFKSQMFEIVNNRSINNKPTFITSNCKCSELGELLDGSIISRMGDPKKWALINLPAKDLRKLNALTF